MKLSDTSWIRHVPKRQREGKGDYSVAANPHRIGAKRYNEIYARRKGSEIGEGDKHGHSKWAEMGSRIRK